MITGSEDALDPTDPTLVPIEAADDCGEVTYSIAAYQMSGGCPNTWMRVWTATDACGNVSEEAEQYLELYDIIDPVPVITCPADVTLEVDANCTADITTANTGMATGVATDNCDDDVAFTINYSDVVTTGCTGSYVVTRTWTMEAEDDCDNDATTSCVQTITVEDNTAPIIAGGADLTVECDGDGNSDDLAGWLDGRQAAA